MPFTRHWWRRRARRKEVRCLAWCLMPNHVHLILVPSADDGLRAALADAHRRYSRRINFARGWTGYLWQGRFASYPMDEAHLMAAVRYVELNPVRAKLAKRAEDWRWSSARAHVSGKADGLTDLGAFAGVYRNWGAMLARGLEAGDLPPGAEAAIEAHQRTGRPWGDAAFIERLEGETGRTLKRQTPGPKPKRQPVCAASRTATPVLPGGLTLTLLVLPLSRRLQRGSALPKIMLGCLAKRRTKPKK
ncbi:MAG TPA: transposase [Allosphingosinicella sp.]|nr:transposase [Allosphingosinicella sp.]